MRSLSCVIVGLLAAAPALADSRTSGAWTYTYEPSSTGKGGIVTALSSAPGVDRNDPSYLVARCMGGRTELLVGGAGGWGTPGRTIEVTTAIDDGASETSHWDVSTNGKAAFLDRDVEGLLKRLPDDGRIRVSVRDATGETRSGAFSTKGFAEVRDKIAHACGWPR